MQSPVAAPGSNTNTLSVPVTFKTTGDSAIAFVRMSGATSTVSIKDALGNVYTPVVSQVQNAGNVQIQLFLANNIKGGANTVTANFGASNSRPWLAVYEFTPISGVINTSSAKGKSNTADSGTVVGPGGPALYFSGVGVQSNWKGTITAGGGYTMGVQDTNKNRAATEYAILSSNTGNHSGVFQLSASTNWSVVVAAFKP